MNSVLRRSNLGGARRLVCNHEPTGAVAPSENGRLQPVLAHQLASARKTWPTIPLRPIRSSSSPSRTSAGYPDWIPPRDCGSRCTAARPGTVSEKPVWPGPRLRSLPRSRSRTLPSQPPGSHGCWSLAPRRADSAGESGLKAKARSIKPIVIEASLRKAASGFRVAAVVHRMLPGSGSSPFSQREAAASFSPSRPIQIPRTTKITRPA